MAMDSVYLRLSVTDRCDLRCGYCMPAGDAPHVDARRIASFEEVVRLTTALAHAAPLRKIRLTGGEPLVRRDLPTLVRQLAQAHPDTELCLTTNGQRFAPLARDLAAAGLHRVNISLDTLDPGRFRRLTGGGSLERTIEAVDAAVDAGLLPVRLNRVSLRGINDDEVGDFVRFALDHGAEARFLELMSIGPARTWVRRRRLTGDAVTEVLSRHFEVARLGAEGTSIQLEIRDGDRRTRVGLISPVTRPFCGRCDRLRLDHLGRLFGCLHDDAGTDVLGPLRLGEEVVELFVSVLSRKAVPIGRSRRGPMSAIGG
jgi:cyclic pyranopterin phosphate synthase